MSAKQFLALIEEMLGEFLAAEQFARVTKLAPDHEAFKAHVFARRDLYLAFVSDQKNGDVSAYLAYGMNETPPKKWANIRSILPDSRSYEELVKETEVRFELPVEELKSCFELLARSLHAMLVVLAEGGTARTWWEALDMAL